MTLPGEARNTDAADVVAQALPSLQHLRGKVLVIKLGGSALERQRMILQDVLWLRTFGIVPVLVHGGGPAINAWLEKMHLPMTMQNGLRVTDAATLEIVQMVLCGQINPELVSLVTMLGGKAIGLCGTDGDMIRARVADPALGFVGAIEAVHPEVVQLLLTKEYIPIIAPLGQGPDGLHLNINADLVAAHLAGALGAERLIFLSDIPGIRRADGSLISELDEAIARQLIQAGVINGGMVPKVRACLLAARMVSRVHILDGGVPHLLLSALFAGSQEGTEIVHRGGSLARSRARFPDPRSF